jgi:hypothetical protein
LPCSSPTPTAVRSSSRKSSTTRPRSSELHGSSITALTAYKSRVDSQPRCHALVSPSHGSPSVRARPWCLDHDLRKRVFLPLNKHQPLPIENPTAIGTLGTEDAHEAIHPRTRRNHSSSSLHPREISALRYTALNTAPAPLPVTSSASTAAFVTLPSDPRGTAQTYRPFSALGTC